MTIFYIKLKVTDYSVVLGNSSVTCVSVATWKIPSSKNVNKTKAKTNKLKSLMIFSATRAVKQVNT